MVRLYQVGVGGGKLKKQPASDFTGDRQKDRAGSAMGKE
jgi:hypothetical protein